MNCSLRFLLCVFAGLWLFGGVFTAESQGSATAVPSGDLQRVECVETPKTITLSNERVRLVLNKERATLDSLQSEGRELLPGAAAGYVQIAFESNQDRVPVRWEAKRVRREAGLAEIAFVNTSPECPLDFSVHYILRSGDPGFYVYLVWGHDTARVPRKVTLAQYNYALRIHPAVFTTSAVDDERILRFPAAGSLKKSQLVMDATYRLAEGGFYSKYFHAAERDEKHRVHGAMSDDGWGLWVVMPSHEHLNGGPEHQELTVHQAGDSHVLLYHAAAAHYGAGVLRSDPTEASWRKVSAPCFIYLNRGSSHEALWADAKQRAEDEEKQWPYPWLDPEAFAGGRGTVSGRVVSQAGGETVGAARVILAAHEEEHGPLAWQQQWRGYRFSGWAAADGTFQIPKVRPGLYDLFVWQAGKFGWFCKSGVRVEPGRCEDVGELRWDSPKPRQRLWQIGRPDRSGGEFGYAEQFRQWGLWDRIARECPGGVRFEIGKNTERDWPFLMSVTQAADFQWMEPDWQVEFEVSRKCAGKAFLTLGLAGYEGRRGRLRVFLNGQPVGEVGGLVSDSAAHRSGIHGAYQERELEFEASCLREGKNTLSFRFPTAGSVVPKTLGSPAEAILWDALRLEVQD
ncbi:MAG: hypothetical protein RLZZ399_3051 [Verrucomicrobiota bacterium]|jgi:rhamnogalacturonan endolyase